MALSVTTSKNDLKVLFNNVEEIYYKATEITSNDLGASLNVDMELPVLEEGVTFNSGEAEVTEVKLTTGDTWTSKSTKGDSDISFQVASIAGPINDLMMKKVNAASVTAFQIGTGETYTGQGYSLAPKKIKGSLIMRSEDRQTIIVLPSVEMYASFVAADGDNPAYFNISVTPVENSEGADIFILNSTNASQVDD